MCLKAAQNPPKPGLVFGRAVCRVSVILLCISTILAVPGVVCAQVSWPMYQGNAGHTGYVPVSFDPNDFTLDWEVSLAPTRTDFLNPVTAVDGRVFVSSFQLDYVVGQDDFFTLDAEDGSILWSKDFGNVDTVNPPAYDNGLVYLQIVDFTTSFLYTFDAESGVLIDSGQHYSWSHRYHAPTIVDSVAYVGGGEFIGVYAFDFDEELPIRWSQRLKEYALWTPAVDGIYTYTYLGGVFNVFGCADGTNQFSIVDNTTVWALQQMDLAPVLGGRNDALVVHNGRMLSFDLVEKDIGWFVTEGFEGSRLNSLSGQVSVANGVIYAINNGNVDARDQDDGSLLWSWTPPAPYVAESTIVVTDSHLLVTIVDVNWQGLSDEGSEIHAIDLTTHLSVWAHHFPPQPIYGKAVRGDLAWSEGRLYFARNDGILTAFKLLEPYEESAVIQFANTANSADEDAGFGTVTLRRAGTGAGTVGVTITSQDGSAVAGEDYTAVDQVVNWSDGDTSFKNVQVAITNDSDVEGPENLILTLHDVTGPTSLGVLNRALLTIVDDEVDVLRFSSSSSEIREGDGPVTVYVERNGPASGDASVAYETSAGTAAEDSDYQPKTGTLNWGPGDTVPKAITLTLVDDGQREGDENFSLALSNPSSGALLGSPAVFVVTILDDDGPEVSFASSSYPILETDGDVDLTVSRTGEDDGAISIEWSTGGGSASPDQDYAAALGTLDWAAGDSTDRTITITVLDDDDIEGGENFQVSLANPSGDVQVGVHGSTTVSIADDEALEVRINTTTPNIQNKPAVASNLHGNSVVVWTSWNQDGWGWGIYGQRFDAGGDPVGEEFQINQTTDDDQQNPDVGIALDGSFIVVWQTDTESGTEIVARRFNASATPLADEFVVNTSTSGTQSAPKIAIDGGNRSMIVWQAADAWSTGIFARVFGSDGTPDGDEFAVNTTTDQSQDSPAIGGSPEGGFVVVWESWGQDDGISESVVGRRWNGVGDPIGGEFTVNTAITGDQSQPVVGVVGSGAFLVAWQDPTGLDGSGYSVRGQWFDGDGVAAGSEFLINAFTDGNQRSPAVGGEDYGRVAVVWESFGQDGSGSGVFGRLLDDDGTFASEELPFNNHTDGAQYQVDVACSKNGVFWTVWASQGQDAGTEGVYGAIRNLPSTPMLFDDDFESGDLSTWSASTP